MKKLLLIGILAASVILLLTCENGFNILGDVETEVKIANDKFLEIQRVGPSDNEQGVNPGRDIEIQFDRDVNPDLIETGNITIVEEGGAEKAWLPPAEFDIVTNTLTVATTGLEATSKYIITLSALKGTDGSELQDDYIWSFNTGAIPSGNISLSSNNTNSQNGYTDSSSVTLTITGNELATSYFLGENLSDFDDPGSLSWTTNSFSITPTITDGSYIIPSAIEGNNTVYVMHRCSDGSGGWLYSLLKEATITLDTDPPDFNVLIDNGNTYSTDTSLYVTISISNEADPELCKYKYYTDVSAETSYSTTGSSPNSFYPVYVGSGDGVTKSVNVTVMDPAGNETGPVSDSIIVDTVDPDPPNVTGPTSPTIDTTPQFSWTTGDTADGSGNFYGRYYTYLDSSGKTGNFSSPGNTTDTSYSPSVSVSGIDKILVRMYVKEKDAAGNWSSESSDFVIVSRYLPFNEQKGVSTRPSFYWPSVTNGSYDLLLYNSDTGWATIAEDLTKSSYKWDLFGNLDNRTTYKWKVGTSIGIMRPTFSDEITFQTE